MSGGIEDPDSELVYPVAACPLRGLGIDGVTLSFCRVMPFLG